jgi:hypothetical protein
MKLILCYLHELLTLPHLTYKACDIEAVVLFFEVMFFFVFKKTDNFSIGKREIEKFY